MKSFFFITVSMFLFIACHESAEQRAIREARVYTMRNCPTPVVNYSRTDSVTFEKDHRTFVFYCTFVDVFDDAQRIEDNKELISQELHDEIASKTSMKRYVDAGFAFTYIVRSEKDPSLILYKDTIKIEKKRGD